MALIRETLEDLEGRLEPWKGALESKGLRVNVKKTKILISSENAGKVKIECKLPIYRCFISNKIFFLPKVQSCKLYNKYIIASAQITNTEIFLFTTVLVFKLFSCKVFSIKRQGYFLRK